VQSEVAAAIARSLMIELLPGASPAGPAGTRDPEAYQAYLKGRFHWNKPRDPQSSSSRSHGRVISIGRRAEHGDGEADDLVNRGVLVHSSATFA